MNPHHPSINHDWRNMGLAFLETHNHRKQKIEEGYGCLFHRLYSIPLEIPIEKAIEGMRALQANPNEFSPQVLARFEKVKGAENKMEVGDEFQIHITGPWNGPVRVAEVDERGFRFVTLEGHLEAGEIRFWVQADGASNTTFKIESWARSRDTIVDLVYDKIPVARFAQTQMWSLFCQSFAERVLGAEPKDEPQYGEVQIITERRDQETGAWKSL